MNAKLIEYNGEKLSIRGWARKLKMHPNTLYDRIVKRRWSIERALNEKPTMVRSADHPWKRGYPLEIRQ